MENFRLRSEVSDQRAINEWPNQEPSRRVEFLHVEVVGCIVIKRERRFTWGSDLHPRVATSSIELRHFEDLLYSLLPLYAKFQCHRIMDHNPRRSAVEVCASTTVKVVKWSSCGFIRCWPSSVISFASGITLKVCFRSLPTPELFIEETREQHKRSGGPWSFGWLEWNRREKLIFSQKFASSDKEWFYTPNQFECFFPRSLSNFIARAGEIRRFCAAISSARKQFLWWIVSWSSGELTTEKKSSSKKFAKRN